MIRVTLTSGDVLVVDTIDTAVVNGVPHAILDGGDPVPWSSIQSVGLA